MRSAVSQREQQPESGWEYGGGGKESLAKLLSLQSHPEVPS